MHNHGLTDWRPDNGGSKYVYGTSKFEAENSYPGVDK